MARKPDELTPATLQEYLEELQGEYDQLEAEQEEDSEPDEEMERLQTRIDSVEAALDALSSVE
jgi:hypothetical protein